MPTQQVMQTPRFKLAESLMAQGGSTAPVQSPLEGIARALTGVAGGYIGRKEQELQKEEKAKQGKALAEALASGTPDLAALAANPATSDIAQTLAIESYKAKMKAQELEQYLGGGSPDADSLARAGIATGNPQLMQYAQMMDGRKKLTKDQWGNPIVMDISNPNGGMATSPMSQSTKRSGTSDFVDQGGGIFAQDLPAEPTGNGAAPPAGGGMPQQQALDEMASLGIPNTPQGWAAYGKYKDNQRAENDQAMEKNKKYEDLNRMESRLPELFSSVKNLSNMGKDATYTRFGSLKDEFLKELGLGATEGSVASSKYMASVRNQVLPLLRETFGAQFTVKEGESLLETLGAGYKSPEEKDAILQSFIDQKVASVNSERRRVGLPEVEITPPQIENNSTNATYPIGTEAEDANGNRIVFNGKAWEAKQ